MANACRDDGGTGIPITSTGLPILASPCLDATQFRIERFSSEFSETCRGRFGGKRCNARIAKYRRVVAAPTFLGIEKQSKSSESQQVQVWFCPTKFDHCILGLGAKWILN